MRKRDQFAHAAVLNARDLHRLHRPRVGQAQIAQPIAIDKERGRKQQPLVARRKEDMGDAVERHVLPSVALFQRHAIEQFAGRIARLPLVEGDVALRIAIFHDNPAVVSIDPIDRAAPGMLAQLH